MGYVMDKKVSERLTRLVNEIWIEFERAYTILDKYSKNGGDKGNENINIGNKNR